MRTRERAAERNQIRREKSAIGFALEQPRVDHRVDESALQRICALWNVCLEMRHETTESDVGVIRFRKNVRVALEIVIRVRNPQHVVAGRLQRLERRLLHHVDREHAGSPGAIDAETLGDHAVHAVGRDHERRASTRAIARLQRHRIRVGFSLRNFESLLEPRAGAHRGFHERMIEFDPPNEQNTRLGRVDIDLAAVGTLDVHARQAGHLDWLQRVTEPRKSPKCAAADAAAARLVPRKYAALDDQRKRACGCGTRRAAAGDDHVGVE